MDVNKQYKMPRFMIWLGYALLALFFAATIAALGEEAYRKNYGPLALDKAIAAYQAVDDWGAANRAWIACKLACSPCGT